MAMFTGHFSTLSLLVISASIIVNTCNAKTPNFTSILVFGDSTVDTGNNNYIGECLIRANFLPYGRDFPHHSGSGRFSNARLIPDLLASILGLKHSVPPYLDPSLADRDLLTGVNFASGTSGIDDLTSAAAFVISLSQQIVHFKHYCKRLKKIAGEEEAERILENAFVLFSSGTNDYTNNFYNMPLRVLEFGFNISRYQDFLLDRLESVIEELHELGLRKIVVVGLPPVGCLPFQITLKELSPNSRSCIEIQNSDAKLYNRKLKKLLPHLQRQLPRSSLVYADIYNILFDMHNHPAKYDLEIVERGCCGTGTLELGPICNILTPTCDDASKYMFWDSIHPTEVVYRYIAQYFKKHVIPKFQLQQYIKSLIMCL